MSDVWEHVIDAARELDHTSAEGVLTRLLTRLDSYAALPAYTVGELLKALLQAMGRRC
jgi:hypothetical protein